jgi:hypothetical protein
LEKRTPQITFASNVTFLSDFLHMLPNFVNIRLQSGNDMPPIQNDRQISFCGRNAVSVLKWMYKNSTVQTRLDRKYIKYQEVLAERSKVYSGRLRSLV